MRKDWRKVFQGVLGHVNVADFARTTGRPYRTVQSWRLGDRNPPREALDELVGYLRSESKALAAAADELESAAPPRKEEWNE